MPWLTRLGLEVTNATLHCVHIAVIAFTATGWMFCQTRPAHLITVGLIAASWLGIGYFVGFGYCFITDLQWRIRAQLGKPPEAGGYLQYLTRTFLRREVSDKCMDQFAYTLTSTCVLASVVLMFFDDSC